MNTDCQTIIFSDEAYNAIMTETFKKDPLETGGILLGHILDNGIWIVMEVLPLGWRSTFQYAYFEYDEQFVNYVAQNESKKYEQELQLLGLWHRHPGSMDTFSGTDDGTNRIFAGLHSKGAISGLVNIDPRFRLTMYHCSNPLRYTKVDVEVGDDLIPEEYFKWKYYDEEKGLNPYPPQKKNDTTNTENLYEISGGNRKTTSNGSSIITEFPSMRFFTSKYLFLFLFVIGAIFSLFSFCLYNKQKETEDIKSMYHFYYTEDIPNTPSTDSIANKAREDFEKQLQKVELIKDSIYNNKLVTEIDKILKEKGIVETFRNKERRETPEKYNAARYEHLAKVNAFKDSITLVFDSVLIKEKQVKMEDDFVKIKVDNFVDDFNKSYELTPDIAKKGIKTVVLFLVIASLMSFLLVFLPRKHKSFVEWAVIGISLVIAALFAKLFYPVSLAFITVLFVVFVLLCFVVLVSIFILKSFNLKNIRITKSSKTAFWYQLNPNLYLYEEREIRKRFADAEKNVENGTVLFFINTYKKIVATQDDLSFQLVYSADYLVNKEIKIYLISPDLNELLGGKIKDFPYIGIDGAGESYLNFSKTLPKDKVSGMEVIRKFYEWLQQYKEWKSNRINIKDIKL